jgi:hypothetical protein
MAARPIAPGGVFRIRPQPIRDYIQKGEERKPRPPALDVSQVDDPTAPLWASDRVTLSEQSRAALRGESDRARAELRAFEQGRGADRRPLPVNGPSRSRDSLLADGSRVAADRLRPLAQGSASPSAVARVERPGFRPGERERSERDFGRAAEGYGWFADPPGSSFDLWA